MKRTKLVLGTMILGLGITGAAWAQPVAQQTREARPNVSYVHDRADVNRGDRDQWQRGDRDDDRGAWARNDRDTTYGTWNARGDGDRDDHYMHRDNDRDSRARTDRDRDGRIER